MAKTLFEERRKLTSVCIAQRFHGFSLPFIQQQLKEYLNWTQRR